MSTLDKIDQKILNSLQLNGRLSNGELAEEIGLSASQCSRRRTRLETEGYIVGYHASVDRSKTGHDITCLISISVATHNPDNAQKLASLLQALPHVLEAYSLTGEMDYMIKVVTKDLQSLSRFISDSLLAHDAVSHVKTTVVLEVIKETVALPLG